MDRALHDIIERLFDAVQRKDLETILSFIADDARMFDPHYPKPHMTGRKEIAEGLRWGFASLETMGFTIERIFHTEEEQSVVVQTATSHTVRGGFRLEFPQLFVIDIRDGLIAELRAFVPYGPHGIGGAFLAFERLKRRIVGKK